jgi:N-acetyl sugar amidotransferase
MTTAARNPQPATRVCTRCVMDTSDPDITFDAEGVCSHCHAFDRERKTNWFPNEEGARRWAAIADRVRKEGEGKPYDSILGLSGGVDSSYLALKVKEWGLRPLVVHVDAGWNSELAVANIERLVKHCGFDLHTHVVDWQDMRELQLAFLRAAVANQDVPQDHAFFAVLYNFATKNGIRHVLHGGNFATESVLPRSWQASNADERNLRAIHKRYGTKPLRSYPTIGFYAYYLWYPFVKRMNALRPLDYMPYSKAAAIAELTAVGWRAYPRKHGESIFTKFFQNHYLPVKFGLDKRKPHLSSLILAGEITRAEAVAKLAEPLYDPTELEADIAYLCKKLQIDRAEFDRLMAAPIHHYSEFPNDSARYGRLKAVQAVVQRVLGRRVRLYS